MYARNIICVLMLISFSPHSMSHDINTISKADGIMKIMVTDLAGWF